MRPVLIWSKYYLGPLVYILKKIHGACAKRLLISRGRWVSTKMELIPVRFGNERKNLLSFSLFFFSSHFSPVLEDKKTAADV